MAHRPHKFRALSKPKHIHKSEHRHYWPYIPLLLMMLGSFLVFAMPPVIKSDVLAYATDMSVNQLLTSTNTHRIQQGSQALAINKYLNNAAQAKANDMVKRNYWSHNTPEGQEPWVFVSDAGYNYLKAGENLAYGFNNSDDTVTGWMNSPPHKANLLDTGFTEVGFGFANGQNFNNKGPETVVVAMYGKPQPAKTAGAAAQDEGRDAPAVKPQGIEAPVTSDNSITREPATMGIAKIQTLTNGRAPWTMFAIGLIVGISLVVLLVKHAAGVRHFVRNGEQFVLHHPLLDTILVSLVLAGSYMSQMTGFIR